MLAMFGFIDTPPMMVGHNLGAILMEMISLIADLDIQYLYPMMAQ